MKTTYGKGKREGQHFTFIGFDTYDEAMAYLEAQADKNDYWDTAEGNDGGYITSIAGVKRCIKALCDDGDSYTIIFYPWTTQDKGRPFTHYTMHIKTSKEATK